MIVRDVPAAARPLPRAPLPLPRPLPRSSPLPTVDVFGFIPVEYIYTMFSSFHKIIVFHIFVHKALKACNFRGKKKRTNFIIIVQCKRFKKLEKT